MFRCLLLVAALTVHAAASASLVIAHYTPLGGDAWTVSFNIQNNGTLPAIGGFTIYFPETEFAALTLNASPSTWDTLVVQPDLGLPAAGFLDSFAIASADTLGTGENVGGFEVGFSFHGVGSPGRLAYDIVDSGFAVLESGFTVPAISPGVPEPATWLLVLAALAVSALRKPAQRAIKSMAVPA